MSSPIIWAGTTAKSLKSIIDINGNAQLLSGSVDPSSSATSAPKGSLYLNTSNGNLYRKTDAGSSTNWTTFAVVGSWTAYTPTLSAGFGTTANVSFFWRQVGPDSIDIRGSFDTGTVANSIATMSLPGSLTLTTALLSVNNTTSNAGEAVGSYSQDSQQYGVVVTAPATSTSLLYFGHSYQFSGNGCTPETANNATASNNKKVTIKVTIPVTGL